MDDLNPQKRAVSVSLRHLKLFESVGRLRGVRRASEECHLSQPAVTQAVGKLEEQIGVGLLERRASGSYLNELGEIFQHRVERLFAQIEAALVELGVPSDHAPILASRVTRSQIRSLIAIFENGSFTQAACALDISQGSLNRTARDLERNLQLPLYHRTASGIVVTAAGAEFARRLKLATREIEWGIEEVDAARGRCGGQLVVGAMQLAGSFLLASVLNEFIDDFPEANIRISNGNSLDMLRSLRVGDVDIVIGLLRNPVPEGLAQEALAEVPFTIVARQGHPLLKKRKVTLSDLATYDWIVGSAGSGRRVCFDKMFSGRKAPPAKIETYSLPTIRLLLTRSDSLTLLTSYELLYEDDALAAVPYGPIRPIPSIGITTRVGWLSTQLQANFLHLIRERTPATLMPIKELRRAS
ncbi:MAG TPA: LysR family transcriptional regulator [Stellaceae bacterium]|nr:LysR family transcriptional regulator [Stellaceae bacterium]